MNAPSKMALLAGLLERALEPIYGSGIRAVHLTPLPGGASRQTIQFELERPDRPHEELILRRDFPGRPSEPGNMGLEARSLRAAGQAGLLVPEVIMSCDGPECWETAGIVMRRVAGETIARRILRDQQFTRARCLLTEQCAHFLAGLHQIDPASVDGLDTINLLEAYRRIYDDLGMSSPTFEFAFRWLEAHRPPPPAQPCIVHGDFRLGNLIVGVGGLEAVLDWEGVHLGDPLEDLGWLCVKAWRFGSDQPVAGVGSYASLIGAYTEAGGAPVDPDAFLWWQVFGTLRWGIICMTQTSIHLTGAVRSVELAAIGRRICEQEWDLLLMLEPEAVRNLDKPTEDRIDAAEDDLHGRPTQEELLTAVHEFLQSEIMPATTGSTHFLTRVSINVMAMLRREVILGPAQQMRHAQRLAKLDVTSTAQLAQEVREGHFDGHAAELVSFLTETVWEKLQVANPRYLELSE